MLPRTPELLTVILGTWRAGAVYQPLFTAFGPKAIEHRVKMSGAKLVVTDADDRVAAPDGRPQPPLGLRDDLLRDELAGAAAEALEGVQADVDERALARLKQNAAIEGPNLMEPILDAARAYTTMGEMCDALRQVWGTWRETPVF